MNVEDNLSNESDPDLVAWCVRDVPEKNRNMKELLFVKSMTVFIGKTYYFRRWDNRWMPHWWIGPCGLKFHQDWLIDPIEKEA